MSLNASRVIQKTHREQLILLVIADITEVRQLIVEKEMKEKALLNKEILERKTEKIRLEKAVDERTRELKEANASLEEKNRELINMNNELEAFTYVSSHDLQEPLRKIQTFAGILLERENENLSDKGKNYFRLMQQSAERMQQLIKDLLAFSRISADERTFEKVHLEDIVEQVKSEFKDAILERRARIDVTGMCVLNVIPFQFLQLMHNLIGNALKFSDPQRLPRIKISSRIAKYDKLKIKTLSPAKEYCHIKIADNGIGFEEEFSIKIFEVFQKLHGKDKYSGTGIGLAIVKKVVDNHNGIITATSQLNKGTTFNIYIPTSQKR